MPEPDDEEAKAMVEAGRGLSEQFWQWLRKGVDPAGGNLMDDSDHPVCDRLEEDILRVRGMFEPHHRHTMTPVPQPVNLAAALPQPQEETMSLATAAAGLKTAVGNMDGWFKEVVETHLPAVFAEADRYENDPIVRALEGVVLPPEIVQQITGLIALGVKAFPELQPAAPAAPADPQQPAEAPAQ